MTPANTVATTSDAQVAVNVPYIQPSPCTAATTSNHHNNSAVGSAGSSRRAASQPQRFHQRNGPGSWVRRRSTAMISRRGSANAGCPNQPLSAGIAAVPTVLTPSTRSGASRSPAATTTWLPTKLRSPNAAGATVTRPRSMRGTPK